MSTLVSLLIAAILNFVGVNIHPEAVEATNIEVIECINNDQMLASNCIIIKNEQLFKVKGIK